MGSRPLLRDRIIQAYNHYTEKGYCPIYGLENVEEMYRQYHALGGNGTITELVERVKELPTQPKGEKKHMKINWKVRFKNPVFWFNLAAAVFLPMLACLGFHWEDMTSWQAIGNVLLQAVQNPVIVVSGFSICMEPYQ